MMLDKVRSGQHKLRVVANCGNGTSSFFAPEIIEGLGCNVIPLYCILRVRPFIPLAGVVTWLSLRTLRRQIF
ncbi:MAG: hypothetical protein HPY52_14700 [Firmicutes bacterium]|nr:hypothetical protein [Bacillota bacterium]